MQGTKTLSPRDFVAELETMRDDTLRSLRSELAAPLNLGDPCAPPQRRPQLAVLLKSFVYPERRVPDVLAKRMKDVPDFDIRAGLADQIHEEIHHARLAQSMLEKWGHDPEEPWRTPLPELVRIFDYIDSLETLAEFFSTFLIGEGLFLSAYLEDINASDPHALSPYLEAALADEPAHIELAREGLRRYAVTRETQERARDSAKRLLDMFLGGYRARVRELQAEVARVSGARGH